jgi:hypothetical protein
VLFFSRAREIFDFFRVKKNPKPHQFPEKKNCFLFFFSKRAFGPDLNARASLEKDDGLSLSIRQDQVHWLSVGNVVNKRLAARDD